MASFPQFIGLTDFLMPDLRFSPSVFVLGHKVLIVEDLEDVEVYEGETATFKCRIAPANYGKVHWFLDKTPLHTNKVNEVQSLPGGYHTLSLNQLGVKDSGMVTFEAGDQKTSVKLLVKGNSRGMHGLDQFNRG